MPGDVSAYGAAIIAAVSAVAGGALTAGASVWAEGRRAKREDARAEERDKREQRQATRLLLAELAEIREAIYQSAKSHLTWRTDQPLPAFAYKDWGAVLAATLPLHVWRAVEWAYREANRLNWAVMEMNREFKSEGPIHFIDNEWLRSGFRCADDAMRELEVALGEPRGVFGYTGYRTIAEIEEGIWLPRPMAETTSVE